MHLSHHKRENFLWICGTTVLVLGLIFVTHPTEAIERWNEREPASLFSPKMNSKTKILESAQKNGLKQGLHDEGKGNGIIDVEIVRGGGTASPDLQKLEAKITLLASQEDLEFAWMLPEGVSLVSGELEGHLGALEQGQTSVVKVSIATSGTENRQIHLHVFKKVNGEAIGKMTQYNTLMQPELDAELRAKAAEFGSPGKTEVLGAVNESGVKLEQ